MTIRVRDAETLTVRDLEPAEHHGARAVVTLPNGRHLVGRLSYETDPGSRRPRKEWHVRRRSASPYSLAFNGSAHVQLLPKETSSP